MVCLNSPPSMINNQILCDENVLENEFIREQDELNNCMLDQQSISVKDITFGKKTSLPPRPDTKTSSKRKEGIQNKYLTGKPNNQPQGFCLDGINKNHRLNVSDNYRNFGSCKVAKINNTSHELTPEEVLEPTNLGNEMLKTNNCAGVLNYVGNMQNNFHFITSPVANVNCKEQVPSENIYSKVNFFDSAKSTHFKAPISKITDCAGFSDLSGNNIFQKQKMSANDSNTSYSNIFNTSSTKNNNTLKQAKVFFENLNDQNSKTPASKEIKAKNSVTNIKKSLFELHRNESKKLEKSREESKSSCSAFLNSNIQKSPGFNNEFQTEKTPCKNLESNIIPKELPQNTKKFIEVKTEEVIYLTPDGRIYTEDKGGILIELDNLSSLKPKNDVVSNVTKIIHNKNKSSLSESLSAPTLNINERNLSKPEQISTSELFMNPFANPAMSQMPFGMISPSMHPSSYMNYEMFTNSCNQNNPLHSCTGTPNYMNQIRRIDHGSYNQ